MRKVKGNGRYERNYPWVGACVLAVLAFAFFPNFSIETFSGFNRFGDQALRINTVLLGFFLTMYGLTASVSTKQMLLVKELGLYPRLMRFNRIAILSQFYSMSTVVLSSFYQFFEGQKLVDRLLFTVLTLVISFSFLAAYRFATLFLRLIVHKDDLGKPK